MAKLTFETTKFTAPKPPRRGTVHISRSRLVLGAMMVGATPIAMGGHPRPDVELTWRAAMAEASVEERGGRWYKRTPTVDSIPARSPQ